MDVNQHKTVAEFLANYQGIACKVARSFTNDSGDFEDLFQEICIGLWTVHGKVPDDVRESTYVYRVALNRAISWNRKKHSYVNNLRRYWQDRLGRAGLGRAGAVENFVPNEQMELLYAAIRKLSESDRSLVLLYLDDLSSNEIGEVLGLSSGTVRKRVSRVKTKLTRMIQELEKSHDT